MRILILGAGYGGVRVALDLARRLGTEPDVTVQLVDKHDYHQFRTELHRAAAGTSSVEEARLPLKQIFSGLPLVETIRAEVVEIRPDAATVAVADGRLLSYDRLVVALGSDPEYFSIPGLEAHALTLRSLNSARVIREHIERLFAPRAAGSDGRARPGRYTIVVGGGGLTGVEFASELADRLPRLAKRQGLAPGRVRLILIEAQPEILSGFDHRLIIAARRHLSRKGIALELGVKITAVHADRVELEDGRVIPTATFIWTGGVRGNHIVEASLPSKARGRAAVDAFLRVVGHPTIYAIGDCALALHPRSGQPVAPTAQNAIHQGRLVARNLAAEYHGRPLRGYDAKSFGVVASLGRGYGVAEVGKISLLGVPAAVLKDLVALHYIYSLGGARLVWRRWKNLHDRARPVVSS
ncbi:MAG TPA: NAD(P)/FAD-dependent oxidoreductase [Limnochordia bacterium]